MASTDPHFRLRLPEDLHDWLTVQAKLNERSINAEIIYRLRQTFGRSASEADHVEDQIQYLQKEASVLDARMRELEFDRRQIQGTLTEAVLRLEKLRAEERSQGNADKD